MWSDRAKLFGLALASGALAVGYYVTHPPEVVSEAGEGLFHPLGGAGRYPITSGFGPRVSPITGLPSVHNGIDFGCPVGTPVYSPAHGEVYEIGRDPNHPNGLCVKIGFDGYRFKYLHLSNILVPALGPIARAQIIGLSGNTGNSTGPHLHFEVAADATNLPVNPEAVYGGKL